MATIRIKFYGTRGSIPICDPEFQQFGGNTTCIAFHRISSGTISILDAGTGIRKLGKDIVAQYGDQQKLFMTFTHFHWDHIQGFPFFDPAYNPNMNITVRIFGAVQKHSEVREIFASQMQETYFPVPLDKMGCRFNFLSHQAERSQSGDTMVTSIKQNHPGGSYGLRTVIEGKVVVICTDHEHGDEVSEEFVQFAKDADLLVHEAQYTAEELKAHKGWGHSSYDQAIEVAERASVKQLAMTHHDPDHDDEFLKKVEKQCQDRFRDCVLAREGMEIEV